MFVLFGPVLKIVDPLNNNYYLMGRCMDRKKVTLISLIILLLTSSSSLVWWFEKFEILGFPAQHRKSILLLSSSFSLHVSSFPSLLTAPLTSEQSHGVVRKMRAIGRSLDHIRLSDLRITIKAQLISGYGREMALPLLLSVKCDNLRAKELFMAIKFERIVFSGQQDWNNYWE